MLIHLKNRSLMMIPANRLDMGQYNTVNNSYSLHTRISSTRKAKSKDSIREFTGNIVCGFDKSSQLLHPTFMIRKKQLLYNLH